MILRRLFHVHAALAEFDLALKALDSYLEIVISAKERAEKAAESGELEDDAILLKTLSEGVKMLCSFGAEKEAVRARELVTLIQDVLSKNNSKNDKEQKAKSHGLPDINKLSPTITATAHRAVGIGLANWAHWTPVNEARDDVRVEAIENLEKSIAPELGNELNNSSLYSLALLLAEDRDVDGAIEHVKLALTTNTHFTMHSSLSRERDLVALWHLLALLLSAKHDFFMAERSCEAAFEQFPSAVTSHNQSGKRSHGHHESHSQLDVSGLKHTLIDQLRGREKERIIETRVTQLAFVEILEGPEAAVNHSDQLLSLFATLFQNLDLDGEESRSPKADRLAPPKSSAGTAKSFRGGIFSRNKVQRLPERRLDSISDKPGSAHSSAPPPQLTGSEAAPSVQSPEQSPSDQVVGKPDSMKQRIRRRASSVKMPPRTDTHALNGEDVPPVPGPSPLPGLHNVDNADESTVGLAVSEASPTSKHSNRQPVSPIAPNMKHSNQPESTRRAAHPPDQDPRFSTCYSFDSPTYAVTRFPVSQAQKHALGILVKIWLLIAGLYRRASLLEDAHEACDEASKQLNRIEALVAAQNASAKSFSNRGWGVTKSPEELWADLNAEQGFLSKTQLRPHDAIAYFEKALMRDPDHPKATIGLANMLLDIWDQTLPVEPPRSEVKPNLDGSTLSLLPPSPKQTETPEQKPEEEKQQPPKQPPPNNDKPEASQPQSPEEETKFLGRLAARDRAYGLLSALTKRGSSWDNSEAWYALSRAYEAGGQVEKLKEVLWWCIELEDRRPVRHWSNIGSGVYVL